MIVLAADDAPPDRVAALEDAGVEVIPLPGSPPSGSAPVLRALGSRGIQSLLWRAAPSSPARWSRRERWTGWRGSSRRS